MAQLISVLVPMYNHAHYIGATLASVIKQTHKHLECIVMDDGSTDGGADVVRSFAQRDPRIRLVQQPNGGLVSALNGLAKHARGALVTTLDADDCFLPTRLAAGLADLKAHPELSVSFCGVETIDALGKPTLARRELLREPLSGKAFHKKLVLSNFVASCAGLIRRERLADIGPFARPVGLIPDWDLWLRLASRGELALRAEIGVQVRWDGQNMSSKSIVESAKQHIGVSRELSDRVCARHGLGDDVRAACCDMRVAWAKCINDPSEMLRALHHKRRFAKLCHNDWALLVHALLSMGRLAQAQHYLSELTQGKMAQEVSDEARVLLAVRLDRLNEAIQAGTMA